MLGRPQGSGRFADELGPVVGEFQRFTPTIEALVVPDIDLSLDEQAAKTAFWNAFKPVGEWCTNSPRQVQLRQHRVHGQGLDRRRVPRRFQLVDAFDRTRFLFDEIVDQIPTIPTD